MSNVEAGPELDKMIAEQVMGWPHISDTTPYRFWKQYGGVIVNGRPQKFDSHGILPLDWRPSRNLVHAIDVALKLREDGWLVVMKWMPKEFYFLVGGQSGSEYGGPEIPGKPGLQGQTMVSLEWMRKDDWRYVPVPDIIHAPTAALAICRAAVAAHEALEEVARRRTAVTEDGE